MTDHMRQINNFGIFLVEKQEVGLDNKASGAAPTILFTVTPKLSLCPRMSACEAIKKISNRKVFVLHSFNC